MAFMSKLTLIYFSLHLLFQGSFGAILRGRMIPAASHLLLDRKTEDDTTPENFRAWHGGHKTPFVDALEIVKRATGDKQVPADDLRQILQDIQEIEQQINSMLGSDSDDLVTSDPVEPPANIAQLDPLPLLTESTPPTNPTQNFGEEAMADPVTNAAPLTSSSQSLGGEDIADLVSDPAQPASSSWSSEGEDIANPIANAALLTSPSQTLGEDGMTNPMAIAAQPTSPSQSLGGEEIADPVANTALPTSPSRFGGEDIADQVANTASPTSPSRSFGEEDLLYPIVSAASPTSPSQNFGVEEDLLAPVVSAAAPDPLETNITIGYVNPIDGDESPSDAVELSEVINATPVERITISTIAEIDRFITTTITRTFTKYVYGNATTLRTATRPGNQTTSATFEDLGLSVISSETASIDNTFEDIPISRLNPTVASTNDISGTPTTDSPSGTTTSSSSPDSSLDLPSEITILIPVEDSGTVAFRTISLPDK